VAEGCGWDFILLEQGSVKEGAQPSAHFQTSNLTGVNHIVERHVRI
jgi:hypothetical protein